MPKVTEEYIQNKKRMIVEAAYTLCLRKTVSTVTMQDIINETGLSQGGIYRFYKDVDAIFTDMLLFLREKESIMGQVDEIFSKANEITVEELVHQIFDMLGSFMKRELMGIEKIDFEMNVLAMNDPERVKKILKDVSAGGNMAYLMNHFVNYINEQIKAGKLKLRVSVDELFSYIRSAFAGIQMSCIVFNCYQQDEGPGADIFQPDIQLRTLGKTICYLLGVDERN